MFKSTKNVNICTEKTFADIKWSKIPVVAYLFPLQYYLPNYMYEVYLSEMH